MQILKPFTIVRVSSIFLIALLALAACDKANGPSETPLKANAGADQMVIPGDIVTLNGSASTGPSGFTYNWSYSGNVSEEEINFQSKTTATPSFSPPKSGLYVFTLIVSFDGKTSQDVVQIEATASLAIGGTLTENMTLMDIQIDPEKPDYILESDLVVPDGITLSIGDDHVVVQAQNHTGIIVRGLLTNEKDATSSYEDAEFRSTNGWKGIHIDGGALNLRNTKIENAGGSAFSGQTEAAAIVFSGVEPEIINFENNDFSASQSYDMFAVTDVSGGTGQVTANTFSAPIPIKALFNFISLLDNNSFPQEYEYIHLVPNGLETGNILPGDQVFYLNTGVYFIDGSLRAQSATYVSSGVTIFVKENSSLIFEKDASVGSNIFESGSITGKDGAYWNGIAAGKNAQLKLNNMVISNAGANPVVWGSVQSKVKAAVYIQEDQKGWMWNCIVKDIDGFGFYLDASDDTNSPFSIENTTFVNTKNAAMRVNTTSVPLLIRSGVVCDMNENVPGCLIEQDGNIRYFIWPAIENSYYLIDANIGFNYTETVKFNPGVHLKFKKGRFINWSVRYDNRNLFQVDGKSDNPVIFEGEVDEPGSWGGLLIDAFFEIKHLVIRNGGEFLLPNASTKANIYFSCRLWGTFDWLNVFSNSQISDSEGYGVVLSNNAIDFNFEDPEKNITFSNNNLGTVIRE